MTITKEKPKIEDIEKDPTDDDVVHLGTLKDWSMALCGYKKKGLHKCGAVEYKVGERHCPSCGREICSLCLIIANTK